MKAYFLKRNLAVVALLAIIFGSVYVVVVNNPDRPPAAHSADDGHGHGDEDAQKPPPADPKRKMGKVTKEDVKIGTGPAAEDGDQVKVHYKGTLASGSSFDNSYDRGTPYTLTIGRGEVIPGWEIGLIGMKKGGKRKLVIPPELAYGDASPDPNTIPPGATLYFDVELVDLIKQ